MQWRSEFYQRTKDQEYQDRSDFLDVAMKLAHKYGGTVEANWETNELNFLVPEENKLAFFMDLEQAAMEFYGVRNASTQQGSFFCQ